MKLLNVTKNLVSLTITKYQQVIVKDFYFTTWEFIWCGISGDTDSKLLSKGTKIKKSLEHENNTQ